MNLGPALIIIGIALWLLVSSALGALFIIVGLILLVLPAFRSR
jgi:hypothetical protein